MTNFSHAVYFVGNGDFYLAVLRSSLGRSVSMQKRCYTAIPDRIYRSSAILNIFVSHALLYFYRKVPVFFGVSIFSSLGFLPLHFEFYKVHFELVPSLVT